MKERNKFKTALKVKIRLASINELSQLKSNKEIQIDYQMSTVRYQVNKQTLKRTFDTT